MINRIGRRVLCVTMLVLAILTARASAQQHDTAPPAHVAGHAPAGQTATDPHAAPAEGDRPVVPTDAAAWAGAMLIIIVAMFLMAAVIGPMVRLEIPAEPQHEEPGAEDDPHASHHGHGHGHGHGH